MERRGVGDVRPDRAQLLIGCAVVAAAALTGVWAPMNLVGIIALFVLLRVCWLEDNISNDLIGRDRLPGGYVNTAIRRGNFMRQVLGREPAQDASKMPPHHLATVMRAEIQVWACMLFGLCSTAIVQSGPFEMTGNFLAGFALFVLALVRIDRLMVSLAHCAEGRALPARLLVPPSRRVEDAE